MERNLTKIKDTDRLILEKLDDKLLFQLISSNKYLYSVADEFFWKKRLSKKFPNVKVDNNNTWKDNYLKIIYYADKMKREFEFTFTKGDPKNYYEIISHWDDKWENNDTFTASAERLLLKKGYDDILLFIANKLNPGEHMKMNDEEWENFKRVIAFENDYDDEDTIFLEKY